MFNDELSVAQSQGLMSQLAETDFPFSCAHGRWVFWSRVVQLYLRSLLKQLCYRPSMVPLVNLPKERSSVNKRATVDWKTIKRRMKAS